MIDPEMRAQEFLRGRPERPRVFVRHMCVAVFLLAFTLAPATAATGTLPAFERLANLWGSITDYSVDIEAHEVLGSETADSEFHYAFKRPDFARLDVLKGNKSGSTMFYDGGERVTAYRRSLSIFKIHGDLRDKNLTSLRGNSILSPDLGDLLACFTAHRDALKQIDGPVIDGTPTDAIILDYTGVTCPDDSADDRGAITQDELDISRTTGLVVQRKRSIGDEVVERWQQSDFKMNSGLTDSDLH